MKLADVFGRTYVLNLAERTDRLREMGDVLGRAGMSWQPGKVERFAAVRVPEAGKFPNIGSHGCFLSHLGMLRAARDAGVSRLLIMEDDLDLSPELVGAVPAIADRLSRDDWGIAYLGHALEPEGPPGPPGTFVPHVGTVVLTHFYAVQGPIIGRLIEFLELVMSRPAGHPDGGPMHVDGAISTFRAQNPDVTTLVAHPNLGWQRSSSSDITSRWFDRYPVLRELARIPRQLKFRINRLLRRA